jgi:hydroxyacylglutathione hydrolase
MRLDDTADLVGGGRLGAGLTNAYDCNVYLLRAGEDTWLVDTGCGLDHDLLMDRVRDSLAGRSLTGALLTHAHPDHAGGSAALAEQGIAVVAGSGTAALVRSGDADRLGLTAALRAGTYPADYRFRACGRVRSLAEAGLPSTGGGLRALATPGHSADHTVYALTSGDTTYVCTGDLLFSRGRVVLPGTDDSDVRALRRSLTLVRDLRPDVLLPGHGAPVMSDARWHVEQALAAFEHGRLPAAFS